MPLSSTVSSTRWPMSEAMLASRTTPLITAWLPLTRRPSRSALK
jgi:hypothetical protein